MDHTYSEQEGLAQDTLGKKTKKDNLLHIFSYFSINLAASAAKYCEKEAVNKSAASAASLDYVKFRAVIEQPTCSRILRLRGTLSNSGRADGLSSGLGA